MLAEGRIAPVIAEVLPLAEVRRAHARIEAGEVAGKLVLRVSDP
jgi:NADPH:quinone reductase-like Zn-dependent oxidoreductase